MGKAGSILRLCAVASVLALAGCAPGFGPGLQIGISPGPGLHVSAASCSLLGTGTAEAMFSRSVAFERAQRFMQMARAKSSLAAYDPQAQMQSWKRLAAGGC